MTLNIEQVFKSPLSEEKATSVSVYYSYIPSWWIPDYVGGSKAMDVTVNDVVEIWLDKGEYGWEPVLSGDSVHHLFYVKDRVEPIPEPYFDKVQSHVRSSFQEHRSVMVLISLLIFLLLFVYIGLRKK